MWKLQRSGEDWEMVFWLHHTVRAAAASQRAQTVVHMCDRSRGVQCELEGWRDGRKPELRAEQQVFVWVLQTSLAYQ